MTRMLRVSVRQCVVGLIFILGVMIFQASLSKISCLIRERHVYQNNLELSERTRVDYRSSAVAALSKTQSFAEHHTLVVLVLSTFSNYENRMAIRSTWKKSYVDRNKKFFIKFAIGNLQLKSSQKDALLAEEESHNDILLLPNLYDCYDNLTLKVLHSLTWIDMNLNYSYVLKCDDDSFVQLDLMENELSQRTVNVGLYWGHFEFDYPPHMFGKWKENRWFLSETYLPYALGVGYVLSADVVHKISLMSDMLSIYHNEDVSVGVWTSAFDIERKNDNRFQFPCQILMCSYDNNFLVKTFEYKSLEAMCKMDKQLNSHKSISD